MKKKNKRKKRKTCSFINDEMKDQKCEGKEREHAESFFKKKINREYVGYEKKRIIHD